MVRRRAEGEGKIARERDLSRYRRRTSAAFAVGGRFARTRVMNGNIFNSKGIHVGVVTGAAIFDLKGAKLYHLKGGNVYPISGELARDLTHARCARERVR